QVQRLVDPLEELVDAARLRPVAGLEVVGTRARHLEERTLQDADRFSHADLLGGTCQLVATRLSARRAHEAGAAKLANELLQIGMRQLFAAGDACQRDRASAILASELDQQPDA